MERTSLAMAPAAPTIDALLRRGAPGKVAGRLEAARSFEDLRARARSRPPVRASRAAVVERLREHNRELGNDAAEPLLDRLASDDAVAIVAGQQPGLFGGPLLAALKLAGASLVARGLEAAAGVPVVPIYWCHSEDHDLAEANQLHVLDGGSTVRHKAPVPDEGRGLDAIRVDAGVLAFAEERLAEARLRPDAGPLRPREGERWSSWSSRSLFGVLDEVPVVFAEPRLFRPLLADLAAAAFDRADAIKEALDAGAAAVRGLGFEPQFVATDRSQLFFVGEGGRRLRIRGEPAWRVEAADPAATPPTIAEIRARHLDRISFNVALRPIAQQWLFPVIAHVNGPAENAYFAELRESYALFDLPMPAVVPRPSATLLTPRATAWMEALGIDAAAAAGDPDSWPSAEEPGTSPLPEVRAALAAAAAAARRLGDDATLARAAEGFEKRLGTALETLEGTLAREEERRRGVSGDRRQRLREWIHPRGRPQERVLGPLALFRGYDPRRLGGILAALDPFDFRHHVLRLEEADLEPRA